jgi:hypothetical protein
MILSNSKEVSKKYCYFPTHTNKNSVFLNPNCFKKGKLLRLNIFPHAAVEFFFWIGRKVPQRVRNTDVLYHLSFAKAVPRAARTNGGGGVAARPAGEGAGAPPHHARFLQSPASRVPTKFCKIYIFLFRQILKFQSQYCVPKHYTIFCDKNLWRNHELSQKFLIYKFL